MDITNSFDVARLPDGLVVLIKDNRETTVHVDIKWAWEAAQALTKANYPISQKNSFKTKAEIVAEAINTLEWSGVGQNGYKARATNYTLPFV